MTAHTCLSGSQQSRSRTWKLFQISWYSEMPHWIWHVGKIRVLKINLESVALLIYWRRTISKFPKVALNTVLTAGKFKKRHRISLLNRRWRKKEKTVIAHENSRKQESKLQQLSIQCSGLMPYFPEQPLSHGYFINSPEEKLSNISCCTGMCFTSVLAQRTTFFKGA